MSAKLDNLIGKKVGFRMDVVVFETTFDSPYATLPSYTPFPSSVVEIRTNPDGIYIRWRDTDTGHSAIVRIQNEKDVFEIKESTWSDFMATDYGRLLVGNLLTSPGAVPAAVMEAAKGEATPIINIIKGAADTVGAVGDLLEFLGSNLTLIIIIVLVIAIIIAAVVVLKK